MSSTAILLKSNAALDHRARETAAYVLDVHAAFRRQNRNDDLNIPVVSHAFSNGGCFVIERLEVLVHEATLHKSENDDDDESASLRLLATTWQAQIFDSCPAFVGSTELSNAVSSAFPNVVMSTIIGSCMLLSF